MLSQDDRIALSLQIVSAAEQIKGIESAQAQLGVQIDKTQKLDNANKNLFDPPNALVTGYQSELAMLDSVVRTTITEQDIQDSANKKIQNHFFPNDINVVVPSLSPFHNVWIKTKPFALTYAIGKNYQEVYGSTTKEADLINAALALITSAASYQDIENTSGQQAIHTGTCSNPIYTTQATCTMNGGIWTPGPDQILTYAPVQTLKTNLVNAINAIVTFVNTELTTIVLNDTNTTRQTQNNTATANINSTFKPALNTWLAYSDFQVVPGFVNTFAAFYAYNPALLAPTKLHSAQLTVLTAALNARLAFITTRTSQIQTNLGTIAQDLNTGNITSSSGLYGLRYGFLTLRLNALNGSLTILASLSGASAAQDTIKQTIQENKELYELVLATSLFKSSGNGTDKIHVIDPTLYSVGDSVFIYAEGQVELNRAIKAIVGDMITLNDIVPAKYRPIDKARIYKDIS